MRSGELDLMLAITIVHVSSDTPSIERLRTGPALNSWLRAELSRPHRLEWLKLLGFANNHTFLMRADDPRDGNIEPMRSLANRLKH